MNTDVYQLEQVNKMAKRQRHLRVLGFTNVAQKTFKKAVSVFSAPLNYVESIKLSFNLLPVAPHKRLLSDSIVLAVFLFALSTFSPISDFATTPMGYARDYIEAYALPGDVLITDSEGYLTKINPQTGTASKIGMTDYAIHSVQSGETLSEIAKAYGLKIETIMWENNIGNANTVKVGAKLVIPPVDGISYTVAKGDTLASLSKKYSIAMDTVIAHNQLASDTITIGQHLFLPNAKPISKPSYIAKTGTGSKVTPSYLSDSNSSPAGEKIFIKPTQGSLTQGFHAGHYAFDIADASKPAVWAASSGTVIKASSGTWGGGYGNHVIIDHGDGLQTLYAHLDSLAVSVGDEVSQGQVIGQMGNTGRVYGRTGIHLHFEVIKNGVKQYPGNYY